MNKNKKIIITVISVVLGLAVIIAAAFAVKFLLVDKSENDATEETEKVEYAPDEFDIRFEEDESGNVSADIVKGEEIKKPQVSIKKPTKNAQLGITVDGIKIEALAEINNRLCVIVENTSKDNIEFAVLTAKAGDKRVAFKITALMAGQKAILICSDNVKYNKDDYYVAWDIKEKILFDETPDMQSNKYEIKTDDGSVTIKNKRYKKIDGPIYIVYKRTVDGMLIGSETRRVKVDSLKMREEKQVHVGLFDKSTSKVIFIDD